MQLEIYSKYNIFTIKIYSIIDFQESQPTWFMNLLNTSTLKNYDIAFQALLSISYILNSDKQAQYKKLIDAIFESNNSPKQEFMQK